MPIPQPRERCTALLTACAPLALAADAATLETGLLILDPTAVDAPGRAPLVHMLRTRGSPDAEWWADAIVAGVRSGGPSEEAIGAIERAHAQARDRLGTVREPDEGLTARVGALHPPGSLDLAPDGTPVWTDEGGEEAHDGGLALRAGRWGMRGLVRRGHGHRMGWARRDPHRRSVRAAGRERVVPPH